MALFGNENKKTIEELESYYSNKTQRTGMAWAMAFLSLLITVAVLGGLFFGGRWIYRSLTDDSSNTVAQQGAGTGTDDSTDSTTGDFGLSLNDNQTDGVVSDEAATTSDPNTGSSTGQGAGDGTDEANDGEVAASVTERTEGTLPDTGAATSVMFGIPVVSFFVSYMYARKRHQS